MSSIATLRAALTAHAPLTALVGSKVRADAAKDEDSGDYIVFRRKAVEREYSLDNTLLSRRDVFEIECWSQARLRTAEIEDAVVDALLAADLVPDDSDADAMDPEVDIRCAVVRVGVWVDT